MDKISIELQIDVDELVRNLHMSLSRDEMFDLIKRLDLSEADYDFTKRLHDYFTEEIRKGI